MSRSPQWGTPVRLRALGAVAALLCLAAPALAAPAAADPGAAAPVLGGTTAATPKPMGWWYDAIGVANAHKQATGKGVTVAMWDFKFAGGARELEGQDVVLRAYCDRTKVRPNGRYEGEHGTSMASLIVGNGRGTGPGGAGIGGVAPDSRVLFYGMNPSPVDPEPERFSGCDGYRAGWQVDDALRRGATVFNFSVTGFGGGYLEKALLKATTTGKAVVVASAGEYEAGALSGVGYPAGTPGFVAVNAVDDQAKAWKRNPLTNRSGAPLRDITSRFVVVSAPGVQTPVLRLVDGRWKSGVPTDGTSQAAAIVSGMVALVREKYPDATGNQLVQHLIHNTGRTSYGWDRYYGFGIPNLKEMLAEDPAGWPDVNPLLKGPKAALEDFPDSVYQDPASQDEDPSVSSSPAASSSSAQPDSQSDGSDGGGDADAAPAADSGLPVWVWPVGALVLAAAVATTFIVSRRGSRA